MTIGSCDYCEARLRGYLDDELASEEAERVRKHLADCAACRAELGRAAEVSRLLSTLPAELEPPPHFSANLQLRLAGMRGESARFMLAARRSRWGRRCSLIAVTMAAAALVLMLGAPPRLGAQDLVVKVQASWQRLQSYSCRFVTEGVVRGRPRRFEQRQWFRKPNLFRLETNKHYPEEMYLEVDRVTTYIPGAQWRGKRVAITRPRHAREEGLPFPFGAEWPISADITIDALVRELRAQEGGELLGSEEVLGKRCYELKFHTQRRGDRLPTYYVVWVDQETFLPLKAKIYHDTANQTVSTAVDLQTNILMPSDTFHFEPAPDTFQLFGEVEPFVFALGLAAARVPAFDTDPLGSVRREMQQRAALVPFVPLAPAVLPDGYVLVRVRVKKGHWLDAHWVQNRTGAVIKLIEQPARMAFPLGVDAGRLISAGGHSSPRIRWREVLQPARIQYLAWDLGETRLSLAAAGVTRAEALRLAASIEPVSREDSSRERRREISKTEPQIHREHREGQHG
jgi:outer membrane lipoprotein-sorting protein